MVAQCDLTDPDDGSIKTMSSSPTVSVIGGSDNSPCSTKRSAPVHADRGWWRPSPVWFVWSHRSKHPDDGGDPSPCEATETEAARGSRGHLHPASGDVDVRIDEARNETRRHGRGPRRQTQAVW